MLAALIVAIALGATFHFLTKPKRLAKIAGDLLTAMSGAQVHIDDAHLGMDGTIKLSNVVLTVPGMRSDSNQLFTADHILIRHNVWSLLRGRFEAKSLTLDHPTLYLIEDLSTGKYNYQMLQPQASEMPSALPTRLPDVFIRRGQVIPAEIDRNMSLQILGTTMIAGHLTEDPDQPGKYHFSLRQLEGKDTLLDRPVTGSLALRPISIAFEIENFMFDTPQRGFLPRKLRHLWTQLDPDGGVPLFRLSYNKNDALGLHAVVEIKDVAMTLPPLGARMTDTSGRFTIVGDTIFVHDLRGQVAGIPYTVNGQIDGFHLKKSSFHLLAETEFFEIAEPSDYVALLPSRIRMQLDRFKPAGQFQVRIVLKRKAPGESIQYQGTITFREGQLTYEEFPYPLHHIAGIVHFTDDTIEIDPVAGLQARGSGDARFIIKGSVASDEGNAVTHLKINAYDVKFDEMLINALPEQFRSAINICGNKAQQLWLIDRGLLPNNEKGSTFELGGTTNMFIEIERAIGVDENIRNSIDIDMQGMGILFEFWPYPIRTTRGKVRVRPGRIYIDQVVGVGLNGGTALINGTVDLNKQSDGRVRVVPDIIVQGRNIPIDEFLLSSIPLPHDRWLRDLNLTGLIIADGQIFANDQGEVDFRIDVQIADAAANPFKKRYTISDIDGVVKIQRGQVSVTHLTGAHNDSRLTVSGHARRDDNGFQYGLELTGEKLRFDDPILDLIPLSLPVATQINQLVEDHKPTGTFNAHLIYSGGTPTELTGNAIELSLPFMEDSHNYQLELELTDMALTVRGRPITVKQNGGELRLQAGQVTFQDWTASLGEGSVKATGKFLFGGRQRRLELVFDAESNHICEATRAMMPDIVLKSIDVLSLNGAYKIEGAHLVYTAAAPGDPSLGSALDFRTTGQITDGRAQIGVPITDLEIQFGIIATKEPQSPWPRLDLHANAQQLRAAGRLIAPLSIGIASANRLDRLDLTQFQGSMYGGLLMGSGYVELGSSPAGKYSFHLIVQDAPLDPILHPQSYDMESLISVRATNPGSIVHLETPLDWTDLETGRLSASLRLEASTDEDSTRRGRGELEIRDARLYEVPLALGLLQVLNFTVPASGAFDRASARYLIDGDTVIFDDIGFDAPTVEISGSGTMQYSNRKLDLTMFSSNPAGLDLGPISEMLDVFKNELVCIRVTGTLEKPQTKAESFSGIRRSWSTIFGQKKAMNLQKPVRGFSSQSGQ